VSETGPPRTEHKIVIASNRGPVSFVREDGEVVARRGAGGLVSALTGALQRSGGLWIASAMTEEDRQRSKEGWVDFSGNGAHYSLRYLAFHPETYDAFYNGISNRVLWFLHHYLWDVTSAPQFDDAVREQWAAYRAVNEQFARALAEEGRHTAESPAYLVQDYHLSLAAELLRRLEPDAAIVHFSHIPFAGPVYLRILPTFMREELLGGLLGADLVGFHSLRWAEHFLLCCRELEGARVDLRRRVIRWGGREIHVGRYPISIDPDGLRETAGSTEAEAARRWIEDWRGESKLIVRVDRAELSKNVLRGFSAFQQLLARQPEWRGRVKFLALLMPSRDAIPEYREYMDECARLVEGINDAFGSPGWHPVEMLVNDDLPMSMAAFQLYDVLLVNPVIDGMNLVAKEGPALNDRNGVLVLSENAGAFAELGRYALAVNPFDITETAAALLAGLEMTPRERARRARGLRAAIGRNRLEDWVPNQLDDLDRIRAARARG
jgi:trehalose 6-phosphate synthase